MTPALEVSGLSFAYDPCRPVLNGVSFAVAAGERVGIAGGNGAGKSTLLWCILGLHRRRGDVRLFGKPLTRRSWPKLGVVFQNPEDHLFMPRLVDDLTLPLRNRGIDDASATDMALRAMRALDLEAYRDEPAAHLSLGLRKRAALAAALATSPELLLLDEPTAELDNRSSRRLAEHLARLEIPCLVTSHQLDFLQRATERLIVLIGGSIAAAGPTRQILDDRGLLDRASLI
mgnify:CR=1 FL=1